MFKSRFTGELKKREFFGKLKKLLSDGRHTALNIEQDKIRFEGSRMKDIEMSEDSVSFSYNGNKFSFKLSDVKMVRRLRSRRYLLIFDAEKSMGKKEEKKEEKKDESQPMKKKASKKTTKKSVENKE